MRRAAALYNEASIGLEGTPVADSVDVALLWFARDGGEDPAALSAVERTAALPYEPVRRCSTVAVGEGACVRVFAKGAPEVIRLMCRAIVRVVKAGVSGATTADVLRGLPAGFPPSTSDRYLRSFR